MVPDLIRDGDQHRLTPDDAGLAHPLVTGVEDEIRERLLVEPPAGEGGKRLVHPLGPRT
jgi:hypothetical protein